MDPFIKNTDSRKKNSLYPEIKRKMNIKTGMKFSFPPFTARAVLICFAKYYIIYTQADCT